MGFWPWIAKIGLMLLGITIMLAAFVPFLLMSLSFKFGGLVGSDIWVFILVGAIFIIGFLITMYGRYKLG